MKKNVVVMAMAAALAVSQVSAAFAAKSPSTNPTISGGSEDSDFDAGERVEEVWGSGASGGTVTPGAGNTGSTGATTPGGQTASQLTSPTESGTATHGGGQAVVGDTGIEFVQGSDNAVIGLPANVVSSISTINSGASLTSANTGIDLTGYNALVGTTAVMTYQAGTRTEKTGTVTMPLYVPNLMDGLGTVQVLFYNNMTGQWQLINPNSVDTAKKMVYVTIPNSGTFSVVYKR